MGGGEESKVRWQKAGRRFLIIVVVIIVLDHCFRCPHILHQFVDLYAMYAICPIIIIVVVVYHKMIMVAI